MRNFKLSRQEKKADIWQRKRRDFPVLIGPAEIVGPMDFTLSPSKRVQEHLDQLKYIKRDRIIKATWTPNPQKELEDYIKREFRK